MLESIWYNMVRCHPHMFSGVTYALKEEQHAAREAIRKEEKDGKDMYET